MTVFVKVQHPESEAVGTVPERALPHWEAKGYQRVDDSTLERVPGQGVVPTGDDQGPTSQLSEVPEGTPDAAPADGAPVATEQDNGTAASADKSPSRPARGGSSS